MDVPTLSVLTGLFALVSSAVYLWFRKSPKPQSIDVFLIISSTAWFMLTILGEYILGWATNSACYAYLGCNVGFFGYDAAEHFFFGIALIFLLIRVGQKFSRYSLILLNYRVTILTFIAYAAFVAVCWEIVESAYDAIRIDVLHEHLYSFRLHINELSQSSNLDTMGDISFTLLGSIVSLCLTHFIDGKSLEIKKK